MPVKRKKIDRKVNLVFDNERVIDPSPGWIIAIEWAHHGILSVDFSLFRKNGRDDLAGHFRDAFWSLRQEVTAKTLHGYEQIGLRTFWRFLDDLQETGEAVTCLCQIDRILIDRYLAWLDLQVVTRLKRNLGKPWTVSARRKPYEILKALLINRQRRNPTAVSKALTFPRNPFPNSVRAVTKNAAYSRTEHERILAALNHDLRSIHEGHTENLSSSQVLFVHLLLLASATGRNQQPLLEMKRDSLRQHPLPDRELLVTTKRRGWTTQSTSVKKETDQPDGERCIVTIPSSIGDHIRFLCSYTAPLTKEAGPKDRNLVFLRRTLKNNKGATVPFTQPQAAIAARRFADRHRLTDDRGLPMIPTLARMRPTFATELYRRTRDIRRVQQALGHSNVETTARHYVELPIEADRDHAIVLDGMVARYTRCEHQGRIVVAADGQVPLRNVAELITGGYNTGIARCQNPFRDGDSVCKKLLPCFTCPNLCVFEDDLWRLFSFYYRLLYDRPKINPVQWMKTYGPIIRRIDVDIAPLFPIDKVTAARLQARCNPHPTWK